MLLHIILTTTAAIKPITGTHTHTMTIKAIAQGGKTQQSTLQLSPANIKILSQAHMDASLLQGLQDSP